MDVLPTCCGRIRSIKPCSWVGVDFVEGPCHALERRHCTPEVAVLVGKSGLGLAEDVEWVFFVHPECGRAQALVFLASLLYSAEKYGVSVVNFDQVEDASLTDDCPLDPSFGKEFFQFRLNDVALYLVCQTRYENRSGRLDIRRQVGVVVERPPHRLRRSRCCLPVAVPRYDPSVEAVVLVECQLLRVWFVKLQWVGQFPSLEFLIQKQ